MSYSEENGQVILTMSQEDYDALLLRLGMAAGLAAKECPKLLNEHVKMLNRLNEGNPHFRPYQLAKE